MKKLIILTVILLTVASGAFAQKLIIGERAPEHKVKEWLHKKPGEESKPRLIEFFYSSSKPSVERLEEVERIANKYKSMNVIIITKEPREKVEMVIKASTRNFFAGLDDTGKTFAAYGIQYVPYSVLLDAKGRVLWFGNSASLTDEIIEKNIR